MVPENPGIEDHTAPKPHHQPLQNNGDDSLIAGELRLKIVWTGWTTWWLWRGAYTRSHLELGRENPQRPWYCVLRHGRVGRRQVLQPVQIIFPCDVLNAQC